MAHGFLAVFAQFVGIHVGFFMGGKVNCLLLAKPVLCRQCRIPLAGPVGQGLFEDVQTPEFGNRAIDENFVTEIINRPGRR